MLLRYVDAMQRRVHKHTLKNDRHFLLVDGKVSFKEDAENDPCDLQQREQRDGKAVSC